MKCGAKIENEEAKFCPKCGAAMNQTTTEVKPEPKATESKATEPVASGTNQSDAIATPLGTKVFGTLEPKASVWYSFTTGETEGATYNVTYVNGTAETERDIIGQVYDEYGEVVVDTYEKWAHSDGKPVTLFGDKLENGDFVESEAKKNRRVVILDVDDSIAQHLLTK